MEPNPHERHRGRQNPRLTEHGCEDGVAMLLAKVVSKDLVLRFPLHRGIAGPSQRQVPTIEHKPSFHPVQ